MRGAEIAHLFESAEEAARCDLEGQDRSGAPRSTQIAVFDLDGTLLAGDSTAAWLLMLLRSSWLRCTAAAIALPACLFLIWFPASRRIGASVLLWIATLGYDQNAIAASIEAFVKRFSRANAVFVGATTA